MPSEYSPSERRYAFLIAIFLILWFFMLFLLAIVYGQKAMYLIQFLLIVGIAGWGLFIKFGNKLFKK